MDHQWFLAPKDAPCLSHNLFLIAFILIKESHLPGPEKPGVMLKNLALSLADGVACLLK